MSLQPILRPLIRIALGFYFSRIELFGADRVPPDGPLLIVANHPNSIVDAFILCTCLPRRLHFLATVTIFRSPALAWLLRHADIIAVNRYSDDARAMRSVLGTFERCFEVLEAGGAVAIFPEGITHSDPQLKKIKTGAARIALEVERRNADALGLRILPVGLNFSRAASYRSTVLVHFGEPLTAAPFLPGYGEQRKQAIEGLNAAIESRIRELIVHLPDLEDSRLVEAVETLYLDRIAGEGGPAERLAARQALVEAAGRFKRSAPTRFRRFAQKIRRYERRRARLRLSEAALARLSHRGLRATTFSRAAAAILLAPAAAWGGLHRCIPIAVVRWAGRRLVEPGKSDTQLAAASILAGAIAFTFFYGLYTWLVHRWWGWPVSVWYAVSLPVSGLVAHAYAKWFRMLADDLRVSGFWFRHPFYARRLLVARRQLLRDLDALRDRYAIPRGAAEPAP